MKSGGEPVRTSDNLELRRRTQGGLKPVTDPIMKESHPVHRFNFALVLGGLCLSVALALATAAMVTDVWVMSYVGPNQYLTLGLWTACLDQQCVSVFHDFGAIAHAVGIWLRFCEVIGTLGVILLLISFVLLIAYLIGRNGALISWIAFHQLAGGLTFGLTVLIFFVQSYGKIITYHNQDKALYMGQSLFLGLCSALISLPSSGFFIGAHREEHRPLPGYVQIN